MPDANLRIGATFNKEQFAASMQEGMEAGLSPVEAAASAMGLEFEKMQGRVTRSLSAISDETKAMGATVSEEARAAAELQLKVAAAMKERAAAMALTRAKGFDEGEATALLAASSEKLRAVQAEAAAAQKAAARAAAEAAEEAELSSNVWIRGFQKIALGAKESMGEVREQVFETASGLHEGLSFGAFSGLGELLGIGLAAQMLGDFASEAAKGTIELGHLAAQTGLTIEELAGLKLITQEMGGEWDASATGLVRLTRAAVLAQQGSKEAVQGFADIGIKMAEIRDKSPAEILQLVATRFAETGNQGAKTAAAMALFGRSGAALIPVLTEYGSKLTSAADAHGKLTGVTEESEASARRWTKDMADASNAMHRFGIFIIENAHYVVGALDGIGAVLQTILEGIGTVIVSVAQGLGGIGKLLYDAVQGNFYKLADDAKGIATGFTGTWKGAFKDIGDAWKETAGFFKKPAAMPEAPEAPDLGTPGAVGGTNKADEQRLHSFEQALAQEKLLHSMSVQEEYDFWEGKLGAFAKGSAQYGTVLGRLASLAEEGARKFHEGIAKLKEEQKKSGEQDATFSVEFGRISGEMNAWLAKTNEDLTRTGERWQGYWRAVAQGQRDAAQANAAMEEQELAAKHAAGGLTDLQYAEQLQQIHARAGAAELKSLTDELERLQAEAKKAPHDVMGNMLDPKLAQQIRQLENEIQQLQAKLKQQGFGDSGTIQTEISKPFLNAFQAINQGWLKVQRDLIMGTGNIKKDFVQMGAELVVQLAQNLEKMLAQWAAYELRTVLAHRLANQTKRADDATSAAQADVISSGAAFKEIFKDAKAAAAGAWKATVGIPIVGPVLAPVAAAASFAGVMALAAFEKGGVVNGPTNMAIPILAHGGERVLSATQTQNFERMVNSSTTNGSRTSNVRVSQRNTFNGGKSSSAGATAAGLKKLQRNGKLSFA